MIYEICLVIPRDVFENAWAAAVGRLMQMKRPDKKKTAVQVIREQLLPPCLHGVLMTRHRLPPATVIAFHLNQPDDSYAVARFDSRSSVALARLRSPFPEETWLPEPIETEPHQFEAFPFWPPPKRAGYAGGYWVEIVRNWIFSRFLGDSARRR